MVIKANALLGFILDDDSRLLEECVACLPSRFFNRFSQLCSLLLSIPLTLSSPREKLFLHLPIQAVVQIQKLAVEVFEFVPLLDENVQEKFFTFFEETTK